MWKVFDRRPILPWISYSAISVIKKLIDVKSSSVLEFGSGMSTLWFSRQVRRVVSVEHDKEYFDIVGQALKSGHAGAADVDYRLAPKLDEYATRGLLENGQFDLILVDGPWRAECLENSMHLVKPGGAIYLDNSDADSSSGEPGEINRAVRILLDFAKARGAQIEKFTDFAPACLFASQGILVILPPK